MLTTGGMRNGFDEARKLGKTLWASTAYRGAGSFILCGPRRSANDQRLAATAAGADA
jgi:hypothetical protein